MRKIGILTFHNAINYGAVLQTFALQKTITQLGYENYVIDYQNDYFKKIYHDSVFLSKNNTVLLNIKIVLSIAFRRPYIINERKKYKKIIKFINHYLKLSNTFTQKNITESNSMFDVFVVGSDQVWNLALSNYDVNYLLPFVEKNKVKFSYAASLGKAYLTGFEIEKFQQYLPAFSSISVRENTGKSLIKEFCGLSSNVVLDPTLLIDRNIWLSFLSSRKKKKEDYILIYIVQPSEKILTQAEKFASINNLKIISLTTIKNKKYKTRSDVGIEEFVNLIYNAKMVFTTSFHAISFSIIFHKPFFFELSTKVPNNNSRMIDLTNKLGLDKREIHFLNENNSINWDLVERKLIAERKMSLRFLKENIS